MLTSGSDGPILMQAAEGTVADCSQGASFAFGGHARYFSAQGSFYGLLTSLFVQVAQNHQTGIARAKIADAPLCQMYQNL